MSSYSTPSGNPSPPSRDSTSSPTVTPRPGGYFIPMPQLREIQDEKERERAIAAYKNSLSPHLRELPPFKRNLESLNATHTSMLVESLPGKFRALTGKLVDLKEDMWEEFGAVSRGSQAFKNDVLGQLQELKEGLETLSKDFQETKTQVLENDERLLEMAEQFYTPGDSSTDSNSDLRSVSEEFQVEGLPVEPYPYDIDGIDDNMQTLTMNEFNQFTAGSLTAHHNDDLRLRAEEDRIALRVQENNRSMSRRNATIIQTGAEDLEALHDLSTDCPIPNFPKTIWAVYCLSDEEMIRILSALRLSTAGDTSVLCDRLVWAIRGQ